ncbi:hypothetical protein [Luedemannella flava]
MIPASLIMLAFLPYLAGDHHTARLLLMALSSLLAAASSVPYLRSIHAGITQPRLVTWATWSVLTGMAAFASASTGDWPAAVFAGIGTVATTTIVVVGWRRGHRGVGKLDITCASMVIAGLALWQASDQPAVAVIVACSVDLIGLVPTLANVWAHPGEENPSTWTLIAAGGLCAALAAWGDWTITALAYPVYVAVSTATVAVLARRWPPRAGVSDREVAHVHDTISWPAN